MLNNNHIILLIRKASAKRRRAPTKISKIAHAEELAEARAAAQDEVAQRTRARVEELSRAAGANN
jgi:hypothetical protein